MKKKITHALRLSLATLLLGSSFTLPATVVTAETALSLNTFTMENGASVRLTKGSNGLRFSAEISQTEYDVLKTAGARFGMLIVAKDLLNGAEITPETVFGANSLFYFTNKTESKVDGKIEMINVTSPTCSNIDKDENIEICGSIANIKTNNFTRSFIGRAYVAIPEKNAETGETTYAYHFAPYYDDNVANNTRCMYYVAQRAIETENGKEEANRNESLITSLEELYFTPFSTTDRFTKKHYAYKVLHHYIEHDDSIQQEQNGEEVSGEALHKIIYTHEETLYAQLNSTVLAHPIEKPATAFGGLTLDAWNKMSADEKTSTANKYQLSVSLLTKFLTHHYIFDVDHQDLHRNGLVYAAGMQTFHLYYEASSTIHEEHAHDTLAELLQHFLDVDNVESHFGIKLSQDGWSAEQIYEKDAQGNFIVNDKGEYVNHGLELKHATAKGVDLLITEEFFNELRAYGVETVTFTFSTDPTANKNPKYTIYQAEDHTKPLPVYDVNGTQLSGANEVPQEITTSRIMIYLNDITRGGGLHIRPANSMTNNTADFVFLDVEFGLYHDAQNS